MKKMETSEAVDEYESCRSSVISDLDELEANLYSYVHHERNSCFGEEYSTLFNVSSAEGVCQQNEISGANENYDQSSSSFTCGGQNSLGAKEDCSQSHAVNRHGELFDPASFVAHSVSDSSCYVKSSGNVVPAQSPGEEPKANSDKAEHSRGSSPVLEVISCDDFCPAERNLSKYGISATSTPFKEYVVIDDSDDEVHIELERVKIKPKKKKNRKKSEIKADIRLNTRGSSELICLDSDEDFTFSEKENADALLCGQDYSNSEHERTICNSWTPQMAQFYDESWGGECINVSELQRTMSDDGWKVDVSDEFWSLNSKFQNRRYFGAKSKAWCIKCNQKGHYRNECTAKTIQPRCHRCGSSWHQEYSCNQKICLTCGRVRPSLVAACQQCRQHSKKKCYVCQQSGHPPGCCPDLWRRFHATVVPGEIVTPEKVSYKDPKNTYCCNCASRGHHVFQCKKVNYSDYAPIDPKVTSYVDPEALLKFQNTCSHTLTNWESVGAVAPEYQNESRGNHTYMDRGIKRPKTSGKQQKSKHRKLSNNNTHRSANHEIVSQEYHKKPGKPSKGNKVKKSTKSKITKVLRPEKKICNPGKFTKPVDNDNHPNSKLEKDICHKDTTLMKGQTKTTGAKDKEAADVDSNTGFVERIVVLSPGHMKRIESEEGKEILKYVTDQFKGVTARVVSNPSGVLRLIGKGNTIDNVKTNLFDILNNKYALDQLKQSLSIPGKDLQVKKPNQRTHVAALRSKDIKKKFQNRAHQNEKHELRTKDQATNAVSNSGDIQMNISTNKCKIKKKPNAVHRLKCTVKNGKGKKCNQQGKKHKRESALENGGSDHTRINHSFEPIVNQSANTRKVFLSEEIKLQKPNDSVCEILHNANQVNENVTFTGIVTPGSRNSKIQYSVNRNKLTKRKKKKANGEVAKDKLRIIKPNGRSGIYPAGNHGKKLQKNVAPGLDKLGLITVEVGNSRRIFISDEHNHSRISKNRQCSHNSLNAKQLPVQESSSKELRPQKLHSVRTF